MRQVKRSVAIVMPEIGFDVEPISPVRREETVTKRKPNTTTSTAPTRFISSVGANVIAASSTTMPPATSFIGKSWSVRGTSRPAAVSARATRKSRSPSRIPRQMVGSDSTRLINPPAATAPAPM
jgi:hypothetical protein